MELYSNSRLEWRTIWHELGEKSMKPPSRRPRIASLLAQHLDQRLAAYAVAASAAGVGVLALAPQSEAKIIYKNIHHVIGRNASYALDLNHDGKTDFTIQNVEGGGTCTSDQCNPFFAKMTAHPAAGNGAAGFVIAYAPWAFDLKPGARVGPSQYFRGSMLATAMGYPASKSSNNGSWVNVKDRYLGLKFKIDGKIHYGWARLSVKVQNSSITATLTGYAYETIPNKPIIAGETTGQDVAIIKPAGLGDLARGVSAIRASRVEQAAATIH
jgi:hypothetical protein